MTADIPTGQRRPKSNSLAIGLILLVSAATFFTSLGGASLWDQDEGFFASTALEMHRRGDWIVPTFNGELFGHKPPFMFWMMRLGFLMFGENELGARFFSACFGTLTAIVTFLIGRTVFREDSTGQKLSHRPEFWGGIIMASCLMFGVVSRAATPDSFLVCWIAIALLAYVRSVPTIWSTTDETSPASFLPTTWTGWLAIYGAMGVAVLVKGPIGILLPGATIGLFVILSTLNRGSSATGTSRLWSSIRGLFTWLPWRTAWNMHPFLAIAVVLVVAGPWFALVGWKTNGKFLLEFFGTHNVGRFLQPMENHRGPLWYYVPVTLVGFFPWSMFAIPVAWRTLHDLWTSKAIQPARLFLFCWLVVMVGFFSIASTKLPSYVLPAYPALALLTASWLVDWQTARGNIWAGWPLIGTLIFAFVGVGILVAIPVLGLKVNDQTIASLVNLNEDVLGETLPLMSIGLVPLTFGIAAIVLMRRRAPEWASGAIAVGSALFCVALLSFGAGRVDRHQFTADVTREADHSRAADTHVATFCYFQPSMVFYSSEPVSRLFEIEETETHLNTPGSTLIMTSEGQAVFEDKSDVPLEVIASRPNFPKPGNLLLVRRAEENSDATPPIRDAAVQPAHFEVQ